MIRKSGRWRTKYAGEKTTEVFKVLVEVAYRDRLLVKVPTRVATLDRTKKGASELAEAISTLSFDGRHQKLYGKIAV